jgi:hypothetical protein
VLLVLALTLAGCIDGDGPGDLPPLGRYAFTFESQRFDAAGELILTYATEDSLAGRFDAPELATEMRQGGWNVDAWFVGGTAADVAGIISVRLVADEDTGLRCVSGRFNDGDVSQAATCATEYLGP